MQYAWLVFLLCYGLHIIMMFVLEEQFGIDLEVILKEHIAKLQN